MKINLKYGLGALCLIVCLYVLVLISSKCGDFTMRPAYQHADARNLEEIDCVINNQDKDIVDCRKEGEEIFMPFSFIKKYFDVSFFFNFFGKLSHS